MAIAVDDKIDRYVLEKLLATNGHVQVFKARTDPPGETVALKLVEARGPDAEVLRRFQREARFAQRVSHPNLVPMLDAGETDEVFFIVMEYVGGRRLARVIQDDGPLALGAVLRVVEQAGAALDTLHDAGIMHRDVRSSNVLLDAQGTAFLTDLGFARSQEDSRITDLDRSIGTLDYRAPELVAGRSADRVSDVYSLGCLVYECVVGTPPFAEAADWIALAKAHKSERPANPTSVRADVPAAFSTAVLTALAKNPGHRPPSAASYAKMLRFGLTG
jgi:serine/threonine protein kinase